MVRSMLVPAGLEVAFYAEDEFKGAAKNYG
jgi:hypothetical protein